MKILKTRQYPSLSSLYLLLICLLLFLRTADFSFRYGGIEHDSGWFFGVANSLSTNGVYGAYTNPLPNSYLSTGIGIWGRPAIQDDQGLTLFTSGVSAGPAFILPMALSLLIFGKSLWSFKIFPLFSFFLLLFFLLRLTKSVGGFGGIVAVTLFGFWLYLCPQLYLGMAYEALSEHIALLYLIISMIYLIKIDPFLEDQKKSLTYLILSSFFLSLSFLTKTIFLLFLGAYFLYYLLFVYKTKQWRVSSLLLFISVFLCPILLFEMYRFFYLYFNFGLHAYLANLGEHSLHFHSGGGSLGRIFDWNFILSKLAYMANIGLQSTIIVYTLLLFSIYYLLKNCKKELYRLALILTFSLFIQDFWFILISSTGYLRHHYPALFLTQMLLVLAIGVMIKRRNIIFISLFGLLLLFSLENRVFTYDLRLNEGHISKWDQNRYLIGLQGFPTSPIFSLKDQEEALDFMLKKINENKSANFFYPHTFLVAELSGLGGKVFYPLTRYTNDYQKYKNSENILVFGPYNVANTPWKLTPPQYIENSVKNFCHPTAIFNNSSYLFCLLRKLN